MSETFDNPLDRPRPQPGRLLPRARVERGLLLDLVAVLQAAPKGLRRWSVMRAMRERRLRAGHEIPQKFEDEVERLFRQFCLADGAPAPSCGAGEDSNIRPFFRPRDTAGEVWAVAPACVDAFLASRDAAG